MKKLLTKAGQQAPLQTPGGYNEKYLLAIGEIITNKRHQRGEKIDTLATATGLSKSIISKIENGRHKSLKVETIITLCRYLEIPEIDLLMSGDKI